MEKDFAEHGSTLAAVIVEPLIQGCAGMKMYPPEYLRKLRELCDRYGVLLIADENCHRIWSYRQVICL